MTKYLLMAAGLMLSPLVVVEAEAKDFQIAAQRKKATATQGAQTRDGGRRSGAEVVYYDVTVTNKAFNRTSEEIEVQYVIFVERQEIAAKIGTEQTERIRGTAKIEPLKAQAKQNVITTEVTLRKQSLTGGWHFENGGRIRAEDSLQGIWVKLFSNGEEVGEYVNPTTLRNKMQWE